MINWIFLFLETIRLQTSDFDIFLRNLGFRAPPQGGTIAPETESFGLELSMFIMFIVLLAIFGFFFRKVWVAKKAYAGEGFPLGRYEIMIQAGDYLVGNLSRYEIPFLPQTKEYVEQIPYMKKVSQHLEDLVRDGSLFAYEMRLTNDTIADIRGKSKDILIISSDNLEDSRISWYAKDYSRFSGERAKLAFSYVTSRKHDCVTPDNNIMDVYVISPIPMFDDEGVRKFGFSEAKFLERQHSITIKKLMQTKDLGQAVMMMEAVTIAEQKLDLKDERIEQLKDLDDEWQERLMEYRRQLDIAQARHNEQPLMGVTTKVQAFERGDPWGWFVMFAVSPLAAYLIVPEIVTSIPSWLGAVIGLGFMIGFRYMFARREKNQLQVETGGL